MTRVCSAHVSGKLSLCSAPLVVVKLCWASGRSFWMDAGSSIPSWSTIKRCQIVVYIPSVKRWPNMYSIGSTAQFIVEMPYYLLVSEWKKRKLRYPNDTIICNSESSLALFSDSEEKRDQKPWVHDPQFSNRAQSKPDGPNWGNCRYNIAALPLDWRKWLEIHRKSFRGDSKTTVSNH